MTTAAKSLKAELVGTREIVISRHFEASREQLWRAWTDPAAISLWWGPNGFTAENCRLELRPGGDFAVDLIAPDGNTYPCVGTVREVVENEKLVYDGPPNELAGCGAGIPPDARVTITFEEADGGTLLTIRTVLVSSSARDAARAEGFIEGWQDSLERVADHVQNN